LFANSLFTFYAIYTIIQIYMCILQNIIQQQAASQHLDSKCMNGIAKHSKEFELVFNLRIQKMLGGCPSLNQTLLCHYQNLQELFEETLRRIPPPPELPEESSKRSLHFLSEFLGEEIESRLVGEV